MTPCSSNIDYVSPLCMFYVRGMVVQAFHPLLSGWAVVCIHPVHGVGGNTSIQFTHRQERNDNTAGILIIFCEF